MGCYMSTPDDNVYVTEGEGKNFKYATASCQGWRREQEDAEDCLPYFDDNASLFVLCDGHGGAEVAKYTVEHLPNFIKNHPLYKEGKYKEALEQAFIDFDAVLRSDEVMNELNRIATEGDINDDKDIKSKENLCELDAPGPSSSGSNNNGSSTIVDDVDTDTLRREAEIPLKNIMDDYSARYAVGQKSNRIIPKYNASPVVKLKEEDEKDAENGGKKGLSSPEDNQPGPSSSKSTEDETSLAGSSSIGNAESIKESLIRQVLERYFPEEYTSDDSADSEFEGEESSNDDDGDDEDDDCGESSTKKLRRKKHKRPSDGDKFSTSSEDTDDDDDDDEDDDDDDDEDDDDDDEEGDEEDEEDAGKDEENEYEKSKYDDDDENAKYDDDEDEDFDVRAFVANMPKPFQPPSAQKVHTPGMDSGCTVVVALIKDDKLYVASAGDSRCIIIWRDGSHKAMSFDHKPEDREERERICKAGGIVIQGRVNGGLNLSRALGDFTYKYPHIGAKEQMITPHPHVEVQELDYKKVEYIFLACDGIWNSMKNSQASTFIRKTAPTVKNNLVDICINLFRNCIAPKTDGDGTGCDNMTCIIVRFEDSSIKNSDSKDLKTEQEVTETLDGPSQKRSRVDDASNDTSNKRRCIRL